MERLTSKDIDWQEGMKFAIVSKIDGNVDEQCAEKVTLNDSEFTRVGVYGYASIFHYVVERKAQKTVADKTPLEVEKQGVEWVNGDKCELENWDRGVFIGYLPDSNVACVVLVGDDDDDDKVICTLTSNISKPETPEQKAAKEREEKAKAWADKIINHNIYELAFYLVDAGVKLPTESK